MTVQASKNYERNAPPRAAELSATDARVALLKELADPTRLRVIDRLTNEGPATVTRLAAEMGIALPQLSNHLRRLREAGLVNAQRSGRQVVYELADPGLELLTVMLDSLTGRVLAAGPRPSTDVPSRTCYGHLAGPIGVELYRALAQREVLTARADGIVELGPRAGETLPALGVDPGAVPAGRQRYAFECLDATQRAPHLAGALGDALADALQQKRWIAKEPDSRVYSLTPAGKRGLTRALGLTTS